MVEIFLERFMKWSAEKANQTEFRIKKVIKKKDSKLYVN